jgi:demethylmenaquinone methyltransferase/2-methoxy-6-polyprenyl-1,4-benzoquinol methylase
MIDHFGLLAPFYERFIPPPDPAQLQTLLNLPTNGWLLDAGGGTGRVASLLEPMVGNLVLSDESGKMLKQAQTKGKLQPMLGHVERFPFPDNFFERALVVDALHHFHDQEQAIAELVRVLKKGGRLVIEEPDIRRFAIKLVALAEKLALMGSHFHTPEEIADMVSVHGVSSVEVVRNGTIAAWIVVDK